MKRLICNLFHRFYGTEPNYIVDGYRCSQCRRWIISKLKDRLYYGKTYEDRPGRESEGKV